MDWGSLGKKIAGLGAEVLGEAVPGGGMAVDIVSQVLGVEKDPDKIAQAIDADPDAKVKLQEIEAERETELKRIAAKSERHTEEQITERQGNVNETMQTGFKEGVLWRRAVGWSFAIGAPLFVVCAFVLLGWALHEGKLAAVATALKQLFTSLHPLLYCYLTILGIAGYQDGKMGRFMAGDAGGGFTKAIQAIRGDKSSS